MYIGQSRCIFTRFYNHKRLLENKKHYNKDLQSVWNKSKLEDWLFEVLETCSPEALNIREQHYINVIGINSLFNKAWSVTYIPRKNKNGSKKSKRKRS